MKLIVLNMFWPQHSLMLLIRLWEEMFPIGGNIAESLKILFLLTNSDDDFYNPGALVY